MLVICFAAAHDIPECAMDLCPGLVLGVGTHQEMQTLGCNFNRNQYLYHILCPGSCSVGMSCFVQTTPFGLFLSKINISVVSSRPLISPRAAGSGHHFARILITLGEFFFSYLTVTHSKVVAFRVLFTANTVRNVYLAVQFIVLYISKVS